jgi:hypothetical protein
MSTMGAWLEDTKIDRPAWAVVALLALAALAGIAAFAGFKGEPAGGLPPAPPLQVPASTQPAAPPAATLDAIARCESRGNPAAVSADGRYRGKYQFDMATWQSVGGSGDPALAGEREQDRRAHALAAERGTAPWPNCGPAVAGH